jgi:diaminopimelate epimerase
MRVYERGSGETRSCGTGACAVAVAAALVDGRTDEEVSYRVDVPGGSLEVTSAQNGEVALRGPAVIVARGEVPMSFAKKEAK